MTDADPSGVKLHAWLSNVARRVTGASDPPLSPGEISALLELAREAAHRSERKAAPLTTFLAGAAFSDLHGPEREARIRQLTSELVASTE